MWHYVRFVRGPSMNQSCRLTLTLVCVLTLGAASSGAQAGEHVNTRALVAIAAANSLRGHTPPDRTWIDISFDSAVARNAGQLPGERLGKRDDVLLCEPTSPTSGRCRITDGDLVLVVKSVDLEGPTATAVVDAIWIGDQTKGRVAFARFRVGLTRDKPGWTISSSRLLLQS